MATDELINKQPLTPKTGHVRLVLSCRRQQGKKKPKSPALKCAAGFERGGVVSLCNLGVVVVVVVVVLVVVAWTA